MAIQCTTASQAVSVTAYDANGDGRNDKWVVEAAGKTATVCIDGQGDIGQVLGMDFQFVVRAMQKGNK